MGFSLRFLMIGVRFDVFELLFILILFFCKTDTGHMYAMCMLIIAFFVF